MNFKRGVSFVSLSKIRSTMDRFWFLFLLQDMKKWKEKHCWANFNCRWCLLYCCLKLKSERLHSICLLCFKNISLFNQTPAFLSCISVSATVLLSPLTHVSAIFSTHIYELKKAYNVSKFGDSLYFFVVCYFFKQKQ